MHTALVISGISGEAQMPRPNRLEVTPLHAQANPSQTKAQLAAPGSPLGLVHALCVRRGFARSLVITHSRADTCLSTSTRKCPGARLSPGKPYFTSWLSKPRRFEVPDRVSVRSVNRLGR